MNINAVFSYHHSRVKVVCNWLKSTSIICCCPVLWLW